jgi:hypothetical protein
MPDHGQYYLLLRLHTDRPVLLCFWQDLQSEKVPTRRLLYARTLRGVTTALQDLSRAAEAPEHATCAGGGSDAPLVQQQAASKAAMQELLVSTLRCLP